MDLWLLVIKFFREHVCICREVRHHSVLALGSQFCLSVLQVASEGPSRTSCLSSLGCLWSQVQHLLLG